MGTVPATQKIAAYVHGCGFIGLGTEQMFNDRSNKYKLLFHAPVLESSILDLYESSPDWLRFSLSPDWLRFSLCKLLPILQIWFIGLILFRSNVQESRHPTLQWIKDDLSCIFAHLANGTIENMSSGWHHFSLFPCCFDRNDQKWLI